MGAPINLSWTKHLPEGVGASSRLEKIIYEAAAYQTKADEYAASAKTARAQAVKTARRAERMIGDLWSAEEIAAAKSNGAA